MTDMPGDNQGQQNQGDNNNQPWFNVLPQELHTNPNVAKYKSLEDFATAKLHLDKFVGIPADQIMRRPAADDKDGWSKLYNDLGRPDDPSKYELKLSDALAKPSDEVLNKVKSKFHELGLNSAQAAALWEFNNQISAEQLNSINEGKQLQSETALIDLKNKWGGQYEERVSLAQEYIKTQSPELHEFLNASGLDANPHLIGLLGDLVAQTGTQTELVGMGNGAVQNDRVGMTAAQADAQLNLLLQDQGFQDKLFAGDVEAKTKWAQLTKIAASKK